MNNEIKSDIRLGLFVIIGISIFIIGIFLIGAKEDIFTSTTRISALFDDATGLRAGAYVRYDGARVGDVDNVTIINDSTVKVDMKIELSKKILIKKDDIAAIASDGLMGDKLINITPGKKQMDIVKDGDFIQSSNPLNFDKVLRTLDNTNENVAVVTNNLKQFTSDLNEKNGTLQSLFKDSTMTDNIRQTFQNMKTMTVQLNELSGSLQHIANDVEKGKNSVGKILNDTLLASNLDNTISQLRNTSEKLNVASDQLSLTFQKINNGTGTISQLLSDTSMAGNVRQSLVNIKNSTDAFNQNMEALKHSIFFRGYFKKQGKKE